MHRPSEPPLPPPRQLPRDAAVFVNRERTLADLDASLPLPDEVSSAGSAAVVTTIAGVPGVGKTALAPVDQGWWTVFPEPLPDNPAREWEARTFTLIDFAVRGGHGRGLGRRLLEVLLGIRCEERAVLSVQPTATDTQAIYRHLSWQHLGRKGPLDGVTPGYWDLHLLNHKGSRVCP